MYKSLLVDKPVQVIVRSWNRKIRGKLSLEKFSLLAEFVIGDVIFLGVNRCGKVSSSQGIPELEWLISLLCEISVKFRGNPELRTDLGELGTAGSVRGDSSADLYRLIFVHVDVDT
jgi:hypothetical protein